MSQTTSAARPKGFVCATCGGQLRVIKTRRRATGVIARRRECPGCGHRVTTEERPKGAPVAPVHD